MFSERSAIGVTAVIASSLLLLGGCGTELPPDPSGVGAGSKGTTRAVTDQQTEPDGALTCPATITDRTGMTVPQPPTGVEGTTRLLPDRSPSSMVVCAYPVLDISAATPLSSPFQNASRTVATAARRAQLTNWLAWAPRGGGPPGPCTLMGGDETAYLVGAVYGGSDPSAVVWVAAKADPNSCSPATNGEFVARAGVGNDIQGMFEERLPHPISSVGARCVFDSSGRLGDDRSLAPDGMPQVTVCRPGRDSQIPTPLDAHQSAQVVSALRALPTRPSASSCTMADGAQNSRQRAFSLVLRYPAGPPAVVNIAPGCRPELLGPGLEADEASSVLKLVEQWSKPLPYLDPNGSVSSDGDSAGGGITASGTPSVVTTAIPPQPGSPPTAVPAPRHPSAGAGSVLPTPPNLTPNFPTPSLPTPPRPPSPAASR